MICENNGTAGAILIVESEDAAVEENRRVPFDAPRKSVGLQT
jgi:hypothetical protein